MNRFSIHTAVYMGANALERVREFPIQKALLVCDPFLVKNGSAKRLTDLLESMGAAWEIFDQVIPDPTVELVSAGVARILKYRPDTVIALGGGSAIDTGKAVSFIYTQSTGAQRPRYIAIPTTSGTGSEATSFSVLSDPAAGTKYPLVDDAMLPDAALLDASLTASVPPQVTADTGLDVLTHALEAYVSPEATDFTDALAEKAVALVLEYLPRAVKNGGDMAAREHLHSASCMAGMAFHNATLGLCHGMAHAMGALLHLPHGRSNALLLPHIIAFNAGLGEGGDFPARRRYAALANLAGCCCHSESVAVGGLLRRVEELAACVGVPAAITDHALCARLEEGLDTLAAAALADRCTAGNPRTASREEVKAIYRRLMRA